MTTSSMNLLKQRSAEFHTVIPAGTRGFSSQFEAACGRCRARRLHSSDSGRFFRGRAEADDAWDRSGSVHCLPLKEPEDYLLL